MTAQPQMRIAIAAILGREFRLAFRRVGDLVTPLAFFAIVCTLFPLALGPGREELRLIGPGVVWVAALLAQLLSANTLFRQDHDDGSLELMLLSGQPLSVLAACRVIAYWLVTGLPLVLLAPLFAASFQLPIAASGTLMAALALGTFLLALLGALGAALTLAARQGSALVSLLVLPLAMPILIFGARAVALDAVGASPSGALKLLLALTLLGITLVPLALAGALRIGTD